MIQSKKGSCAFIVIFFLLGVGGMLFQYYWVKGQLPLVRASLEQAKLDGPRFLEDIGTPPGSKLMEPIEHRIGTASRGKWSGAQMSATWIAFYDAPGTHAQFDAWYKEHLPAVGWTLRVPRIPSEVQTEFYRDKWLLTVEHEAWFEGREPHARFRLRLAWDYRHSLASSHWDPL